MKPLTERLKNLAPQVALAILVAAGSIQPALAIPAQVAGGVDPGVGLRNIVAWFLATAASAAIVGICAVKGVHAVGEGRSFMPALGSGVFGTSLAFGAGYALTAYG